MKNSNKIAYILYNDRPMSGLIKGQVISVLGQIKENNPNYDITVIAVWQPWVYFIQNAHVRQMGQALKFLGIKLENRPLAFLPSRYFMYNHLTLPFLCYFNIFIFQLLGLRRFQLIHSRSYLPSFITAKLKKNYSYKCIFDMRSLFPEEHITIGKWDIESKIYKLWKKYEYETVKLSDAFTAVSESMKREADKIVPKREADHITLAVDISRLPYDANERKKIREEKQWKGHFVIAYLGSLAFEKQWNNIYNYIEYFKFMEQVTTKLHMVFIVPKVFDEFYNVLDSNKIDRSKITFIEGTSNVRGWLSAADAGIHVMSPGPDGHTRLGVKVVEYLSCGLPVITNSNVGAAADFVEEYSVGVRLDLNDDFEHNFAEFVTTDFSRTQCRQLAERFFSISTVGEQYTALYERLLGE